MEKCEEGKMRGKKMFTSRVKIVAAKLCILPSRNPQNCVKSTIRIEYLIKQKPRCALADKQVRTEVLHRRGR